MYNPYFSIDRTQLFNLTNVTFTGNTAGGDGGAIWNGHNSTMEIANAILWNNSATGQGDQIRNQTHHDLGLMNGDALLRIGHSDVQGGISGISNAEAGLLELTGPILNTDPKLLVQSDPHLAADSPLIDVGINTPAGGLPVADLDDRPRVLPSGGGVDLGATEFDPNSNEPRIVVAPKHFDLTLSAANTGPVELLLSLRNADPGFFSWTVSAGCGWIEPNPGSGNSSGEIDSVTLTVDPLGLAAGSHRCAVTVSDSSGVAQSVELPVSLQLSRELYVGSYEQYTTIQAAIDAAVNGDTVVVRPDTYSGPGNVELNYKGKAITVRSEMGAQYTFIDGGGSAQVLRFNTGEGSDSVLEGFTILNGNAVYNGSDETTGSGGAILIEWAAPTIRDSILRDNQASHRGGGVYIKASFEPVNIINTEFIGNSSPGSGGGVYADDAQLAVVGTRFESNNADGNGGAITSRGSYITIRQSTFQQNVTGFQGGAFYGEDGGNAESKLTLVNSLFHGNQAQHGGGVYLLSVSKPYLSTITNNTFYGNIANNGVGNARGGGLLFDQRNGYGTNLLATVTNTLFNGNSGDIGQDVYVAGSPQVEMLNCMVTSSSSNGNQGSNSTNVNQVVASEAGFRSANNNDFRLQAGSPAIDAGTIVDGLYSDLRGSARPIDGDGNGVSAFDIGAYEHTRYLGGGFDQAITPFQGLEIKGGRVVLGYEYQITWNDRPPFPDSDPRVSGPGRYDVNLALKNEETGQRVDLTTITKILQTAGQPYVEPFTFGPEHIGTWRLLLEMADDPGQAVLSTEEITIEYLDTTPYTIGREIPRPAGSRPGMRPDLDNEKLFYWSEYQQKLFAIAPGTALVIWYADEAKEVPIPVLAGNQWPANPQVHVVGSPVVELLPEGSPYNAVVLKYSSVGAVVTGSSFEMSEESYSVLHYYHTDTQVERFQVVRSLAWNHSDLPEDPNDPVFPIEDTWNIGTPITAASGHEQACGGGHVVDLPAPYDNTAYDVETHTGPIIPVNMSTPGEEDDLVVVWYQQDADDICWPNRPVRYDPRWSDDPVEPGNPADTDRPVTLPADMKSIVIDSSQGSGPLDEAIFGEIASRSVYRQPDPELSGFNPNEEHALIESAATGSAQVIFALRNDLNRPETSRPYVLLKYRDPVTNQWAIEVFKVVANEASPPFIGKTVSGALIQPPYPIRRLSIAVCPDNGPTVASGPTYKDKNGELYALQPDNNPVVFRVGYPLLDGFDYDRDGDGEQDEPLGTCIDWELIFDGDTDPSQVEVTRNVSWPADTPDLRVGETLLAAKNGLPDITNQCSAKLLYGEDRVRLIDPLGPYSASLDELPPVVDFEELPFHLSARVSYNVTTKMLSFAGYFDDSMAGEPLLLLNIMSLADRQALHDLGPSGCPDNGPAYCSAVQALYDAGQATLSEQSNQPELISGSAQSKALTAGASNVTGDFIVVFGDHADCVGPVTLDVLGVACPLYTGEIKVIEPTDVFDNRVTLRHSGDFGGEPGPVMFEWRWWEDSYGRPTDPAAWKPWHSNPADGLGAAEITVEGDGEVTLSDKWFVVRYRKDDAPCGSTWSEWTSPQLYQGWVKRVLSAINLFEQRFDDFHNNEVNTLASMIQQAGERYEGDAALSGDPENLDALGLIQFYQTLLNRARRLTIDAVPPISTQTTDQTVLLAASRLNDLHMLLGNDAYADALDPTIGFSTTDGEYGAAATSIFAFQNQVASLLDEELALLRGTDDEGVRPFYNRLVWNFTQTEGEVAYRHNYNIFDWDGDGFIDEYDARAYFPQGHGDAWGHYLTAAKVYYDLLRHPHYEWTPRAESLLVAGVPVDVDYEDERRFARVAAAKARTGADVVDLTLRQRYQQSAEEQLGGYPDPVTERNWGVDDWASRTGQATYFDWVTGNALLPALDETHEGIERVDRITVVELREVPVLHDQIQDSVDKADRGLNPLGLAKGVVPFDFDPTFDEVGSGIQGVTYFEQMHERAVGALANAATAFDHASQNTELLRHGQDSVGDFQVEVALAEQEYTNQLIEIYGYPYADDCGPEGTYPSEYCDEGPDLYHYMYVDDNELTGIEDHYKGLTFELNVDVTALDPARYDGVNKTVSSVTYEYQPGDDALGFMTKPDTWSGARKAPGAVQMALSDLVQARADYLAATEEYRSLIEEIDDNIELINTQSNVNAGELVLLDRERDKVRKLHVQLGAYHFLSSAFGVAGETVYDLTTAVTEGIPDEAKIGAINLQWMKTAPLLIASSLKALLNTASAGFDLAELVVEHDIEEFSLDINYDITEIQLNFELKQQLLELENLIRAEAGLRIEVFTLAEAMDQARGEYRAALAEGERLLEERYVFRTLTSADIQQHRYQDMAFRIFRNDALGRYRSQFDLAALYTFLAAKAYDYETGLLDPESLEGGAFLGDIVRQRSIGQMVDGEPLTGTGLADVLKRLGLNFQVFKPRMGIDNPQYENNRFSLRSELFRMLPDEGSDENWRQLLESHRVDDLWQVPEFRRCCRPFAPEGAPQPGIVIPFKTKVTPGQNFFGWPLGAGDSAYSTANFTTKIRSSGVWLSDYDGAGLALTPRVYLVPMGADVQRTPSGAYGSVRTWQVVDQTVPLPFPVSPGELESGPGWLPTMDSLPGELFSIRRHSDQRAYHDGGYLDGSEMTYDGRLVGRSVWNNRWLLIIPGQNLLHDPAEGIERLIQGSETIPGSGERTGEGVSDIKIYFQTYSYPGD